MTRLGRRVFPAIFVASLLAGCPAPFPAFHGDGGPDRAVVDGTDAADDAVVDVPDMDAADGGPPSDAADVVAAETTGSCPGMQTDCNGSCVDLQYDPAHCGGCATACGFNFVCAGGRCTCAPPNNLCGTSCVARDDCANCGGCGATCPAGGRCIAGVCYVGGACDDRCNMSCATCMLGASCT